MGGLVLNQTTFAKLLNNLKKISTSNMEEKTRCGAPYVINVAGGNRKLEIIYDHTKQERYVERPNKFPSKTNLPEKNIQAKHFLHNTNPKSYHEFNVQKQKNLYQTVTQSP